MKPIFDNGHGSTINGVYQTSGKRSPEWECGTLYEGEFNRWVVNRLIEKCQREKIPFYNVSPEMNDVSLSERVRRVNNIYKKDKYVYLLSIHANAGGGEGIEIFTSKGQTKSDGIASVFLNRIDHDFRKTLVIRKDESDGDPDKEANFYILKNTHSPAVLLECGFMDNKKDYFRLWSESYLEGIVDSCFETIKNLYK